MKTILITGATGYLGTRLMQKLLDLKAFYIVALTPDKKDIPAPKPQLDIYHLDETSPGEIFKKHKIDIILHLATLYGRDRGENTLKMQQVNITFPLSLLELAIANKTKVFINTDSILAPYTSVYALTKHQFKQWLQFYCGKIAAINLCIDHFYGPFDKPNKFLAFIIKSFMENTAQLDLTSGIQKRDFIYIDDLVEAYIKIIHAADSFTPGKVHNFQAVTGVKTTIKEAVLLARELTGNKKTQINFGAKEMRINEPLEYEADNTSLKKLGWNANVSLAEGLSRIIDIEYGKSR